jgi:hypothetical protein
LEAAAAAPADTLDLETPNSEGQFAILAFLRTGPAFSTL